MVRITVFVEGGPNDARPEVETASAIASYREGFSKLLASLSSPYQLVVEPIGSITRARKYLEEISAGRLDGLVLIDLDGPPADREKRIASNYAGVDTANLYFMVQEMEAWILSQPGVLESFGRSEGWTRKAPESALADDPLLKGRHPEHIPEPSTALDTVLRRHFEQAKNRGGVQTTKAVRYHKARHGPGLLALLDLSSLRGTFADVEALAARLS